jgi:type IV pilus assembly protein PilX
MKMNFAKIGVRHRERGAALVISLLMLIVMTVLGLAAMQVTRMEERMAGNSRDVNVAFQGAEAGLRDAESVIQQVVGAAPIPCASALCGAIYMKDYLPADLRDQAINFWTTNGREYGVAGTREVTEATRDPLIVTEELESILDTKEIGDNAGRYYYKITSNSTGASDTANVIVESTFARHFNNN